MPGELRGSRGARGTPVAPRFWVPRALPLPSPPGWRQVVVKGGGHGRRRGIAALQRGILVETIPSVKGKVTKGKLSLAGL